MSKLMQMRVFNIDKSTLNWLLLKQLVMTLIGILLIIVIGSIVGLMKRKILYPDVPLDFTPILDSAVLIMIGTITIVALIGRILHMAWLYKAILTFDGNELSVKSFTSRKYQIKHSEVKKVVLADLNPLFMPDAKIRRYYVMVRPVCDEQAFGERRSFLAAFVPKEAAEQFVRDQLKLTVSIEKV